MLFWLLTLSCKKRNAISISRNHSHHNRIQMNSICLLLACRKKTQLCFWKKTTTEHSICRQCFICINTYVSEKGSAYHDPTQLNVFLEKKVLREKTMKSRPCIHTRTLYMPKKWEFDWKIDTGRQRLMSMTPIATKYNDAKPPQKGTFHDDEKIRFFLLFMHFLQKYTIRFWWKKKSNHSQNWSENKIIEGFSNQINKLFEWIKPINQNRREFTHKIQFHFKQFCLSNSQNRFAAH